MTKRRLKDSTTLAGFEAGGDHDLTDQRLAAAMDCLQREAIEFINQRGEELGVPSPLRSNAVVSIQAAMALHLFAPQDWRAGQPLWEQAMRECVRRLSDASLSMRDFIEASAPWAAQSRTLKELEAAGVSVVKIGERPS